MSRFARDEPDMVRACGRDQPLHDLQVMKTLFLVAVLGLSLGIACSSSSVPLGPQGTGGFFGDAGDTGGSGATGGTGGAGGGSGGVGGAGGECKYLHYFSPGCGVAPRCFNGTGGSCLTYACGCSGKVIQGCGHEFAEPYAYTRAFSFDGGNPNVMTCDPTADGDL
jgi:hypothetical protein